MTEIDNRHVVLCSVQYQFPCFAGQQTVCGLTTTATPLTVIDNRHVVLYSVQCQMSMLCLTTDGINTTVNLACCTVQRTM